jgi:hypothetical protein
MFIFKYSKPGLLLTSTQLIDKTVFEIIWLTFLNLGFFNNVSCSFKI